MTPLAARQQVRAMAAACIPGPSVSSDRTLLPGHIACIPGSADDAEISITLFFTLREWCGPHRSNTGGCGALHLRFNDSAKPAPHDASYAAMVGSAGRG